MEGLGSDLPDFVRLLGGATGSPFQIRTKAHKLGDTQQISLRLLGGRSLDFDFWVEESLRISPKGEHFVQRGELQIWYHPQHTKLICLQTEWLRSDLPGCDFVPARSSWTLKEFRVDYILV